MKYTGVTGCPEHPLKNNHFKKHPFGTVGLSLLLRISEKVRKRFGVDPRLALGCIGFEKEKVKTLEKPHTQREPFVDGFLLYLINYVFYRVF